MVDQPQLAAQKRRFLTFVAIDAVMIVIVFIGFYLEFARGVADARYLWGAALLIGFAAQLWFIMGFRRAMKEKGN